MARGKKKEENLTLEEKLEQALVPEEEWPYEVPGNWCWVRLKDVCIFERGITFPASAKEYEQTTDNIACLRTANIQEDLDMDNLIYVDKNNMKNNKSKFVKEDDIIMSSANSRELVGKVVYVDSVPFPMTFGGFVLTIRTNQLLSKFIYYFLRLEFLLGHFMAESTQTTNIANINTTILGVYPFPIPPLSEQKCIVERIESLFYMVDEVKDKIQYVLESSENRKAAILHRAFSGELTEQWRKEQGIEGDSWKAQKLSSLGKLERGKSKHRPRNDPSLFGDKYPFIQTGDISEAQIYIKEHKQSLSELGLKQSRLFPAGTLCITIAANIGNVAILSYDCCFPDSVVGFTPNVETDTKFIYYIMCTMKKRLEAEAPATAQKNINLKVLNDITLNTPSLSEQHEIVRILDELLKKENRVEIICENIFTQIDLLKKSILSRAFRGELGTNNPDEESAIELLKTIL